MKSAEYQDTKEPKKTIKIKVESPKRKSSSRNGDESFFSDSSKSGTYNMVDPSTAPKVVSSQSAKQVQLKQVTRPVDFVAPTPQKKITLGGLKVLPNLKARPTKPIILYEDEASPDCKKVREACSLLDLTVEIRPCPGNHSSMIECIMTAFLNLILVGSTSGFADQMSTVSLGQRSVPFMIDTNPIYRCFKHKCLLSIFSKLR